MNASASKNEFSSGGGDFLESEGTDVYRQRVDNNKGQKQERWGEPSKKESKENDSGQRAEALSLQKQITEDVERSINHGIDQTLRDPSLRRLKHLDSLESKVASIADGEKRAQMMAQLAEARQATQELLKKTKEKNYNDALQDKLQQVEQEVGELYERRGQELMEILYSQKNEHLEVFDWHNPMHLRQQVETYRQSRWFKHVGFGKYEQGKRIQRFFQLWSNIESDLSDVYKEARASGYDLASQFPQTQDMDSVPAYLQAVGSFEIQRYTYAVSVTHYNQLYRMLRAITPDMDVHWSKYRSPVTGDEQLGVGSSKEIDPVYVSEVAPNDLGPEGVTPQEVEVDKSIPDNSEMVSEPLEEPPRSQEQSMELGLESKEVEEVVEVEEPFFAQGQAEVVGRKLKDMMEASDDLSLIDRYKGEALAILEKDEQRVIEDLVKYFEAEEFDLALLKEADYETIMQEKINKNVVEWVVSIQEGQERLEAYKKFTKYLDALDQSLEYFKMVKKWQGLYSSTLRESEEVLREPLESIKQAILDSRKRVVNLFMLPLSGTISIRKQSVSPLSGDGGEMSQAQESLLLMIGEPDPDRDKKIEAQDLIHFGRVLKDVNEAIAGQLLEEYGSTPASPEQEELRQMQEKIRGDVSRAVEKKDVGNLNGQVAMSLDQDMEDKVGQTVEEVADSQTEMVLGQDLEEDKDVEGQVGEIPTVSSIEQFDEEGGDLFLKKDKALMSDKVAVDGVVLNHEDEVGPEVEPLMVSQLEQKDLDVLSQISHDEVGGDEEVLTEDEEPVFEKEIVEETALNTELFKAAADTEDDLVEVEGSQEDILQDIEGNQDEESKPVSSSDSLDDILQAARGVGQETVDNQLNDRQLEVEEELLEQTVVDQEDGLSENLELIEEEGLVLEVDTVDEDLQSDTADEEKLQGIDSIQLKDKEDELEESDEVQLETGLESRQMVTDFGQDSYQDDIEVGQTVELSEKQQEQQGGDDNTVKAGIAVASKVTASSAAGLVDELEGKSKEEGVGINEMQVDSYTVESSKLEVGEGLLEDEVKKGGESQPDSLKEEGEEVVVRDDASGEVDELEADFVENLDQQDQVVSELVKESVLEGIADQKEEVLEEVEVLDEDYQEVKEDGLEELRVDVDSTQGDLKEEQKVELVVESWVDDEKQTQEGIGQKVNENDARDWIEVDEEVVEGAILNERQEGQEFEDVTESEVREESDKKKERDEKETVLRGIETQGQSLESTDFHEVIKAANQIEEVELQDKGDILLDDDGLSETVVKGGVGKVSASTVGTKGGVDEREAEDLLGQNALEKDGLPEEETLNEGNLKQDEEEELLDVVLDEKGKVDGDLDRELQEGFQNIRFESVDEIGVDLASHEQGLVQEGLNKQELKEDELISNEIEEVESVYEPEALVDDRLDGAPVGGQLQLDEVWWQERVGELSVSQAERQEEVKELVERLAMKHDVESQVVERKWQEMQLFGQLGEILGLNGLEADLGPIESKGGVEAEESESRIEVVAADEMSQEQVYQANLLSALMQMDDLRPAVFSQSQEAKLQLVFYPEVKDLPKIVSQSEKIEEQDLLSDCPSTCGTECWDFPCEAVLKTVKKDFLTDRSFGWYDCQKAAKQSEREFFLPYEKTLQSLEKLLKDPSGREKLRGILRSLLKALGYGDVDLFVRRLMDNLAHLRQFLRLKHNDLQRLQKLLG